MNTPQRNLNVTSMSNNAALAQFAVPADKGLVYMEKDTGLNYTMSGMTKDSGLRYYDDDLATTGSNTTASLGTFALGAMMMGAVLILMGRKNQPRPVKSKG